jgi:hypothetical protein
MNIEICTPNSASPKEKGDLLEKLSKDMLEAQNYFVQEEVRRIGSELDLLCEHKVSKKKIYVECKAYRDKKIDAPIIRQLLGTIVFEDYAEGWLIATSEFSKDAKGLCEELPNRPNGDRLVVYSALDIIQSLQSSRIITSIPIDNLESHIDPNRIGEWFLLITTFGNFWASTILSAGIPTNVICYYAKNGVLVEDQELLDNIASTDNSLAKLDFSKIINTKKDIKPPIDTQIEVVEVQRGEDWNDYRPARPQDFVGRTKDINEIFDFFKKVRAKEINTRIFAITGNSGLGKSSLIITLSEKAKNRHQKQKLFLYAIDVRAAKSPEYIYSALLKTLQEAQKKGFGDSQIKLQITNVNHPLESDSISQYLNSLEQTNQLIVLVFDQFEELFSKPELFELFNNATNILLDAASLKANLCIGFAWKTDSTTHSEHPAYFFWHRLSDYRIVRRLNPFSDRESHAVINKFEEVIGEKVHSDLRHNLIVSSQGYPWLLKKLCIHLHEKIVSGQKQEELLENKLDISSLFASDLEELNANEVRALKFIAQRAPVDLVDTIDTCGEDVVTSLLHKRLIIKSGIRLNIYWDIFREYILTESIPIISLRYLPANDFIAIWNVAQHLNEVPISIADLESKTGFSDGTIQNVGTDLLTFGIALRENSQLSLSDEMISAGNTIESILSLMREKFKKHILTLSLKDLPNGTNITLTFFIDLMKSVYSDNKWADKTWRHYGIRMCKWLEITGFLTPTAEAYTWFYKDIGGVKTSVGDVRRQQSSFFIPRNSPQLTINIFNELKGKRISNYKHGSSNAKAVEIFKRYNLIEDNKVKDIENIEEYLHEVISSEFSIQETILIKKLYSGSKELTATFIGQLLRDKHDIKWAEGTAEYAGKKLNSWANWYESLKV